MHVYIFACVIELKWNWHHAFPYALGHLRTIGVSACDEFRENGSEGCLKILIIGG